MDRRRGIFRRARCRCLRSWSTSRTHLVLLARLPVRLPELDAAALLHVLAGVPRQLADAVAPDHRLAAEPRVRREVPRRIEAIGLVVLHLAQVLRALADDHVARRAG